MLRLLSGILKNTFTIRMMQCEWPFMWTCSCAGVFMCGYDPSRVWLRTSLLIGTDSTRTISPPRCSWDHAGLCSVCQTTRRWRSCVRGEAAAYSYLWLFCCSGMARSPGEIGAGIWRSFTRLKCLYLFSRVQPEDDVVIHWFLWHTCRSWSTNTLRVLLFSGGKKW